MSFYASQVSNKSSRYCSSNLYGSNLSTVYADGPPPLDDTQEEDDGEIVFRDKKPKKQTRESELDNDKSRNVSTEPEFNPWCKNDKTPNHIADDDFGDFSGFADFSSAFGGNSRAQSDSSWYTNVDNSQSPVNNFNSNFPNHEGDISASYGKSVERNEACSSKDDDFGCFSGGDDSDFDDFGSFTSNNQSIVTKDNSNDPQINDIFERNKTTQSKVFENDQTIHLNRSFTCNTKNPNFSSDEDFDEFCSSEQDSSLNQGSITSTSQSRITDTHNSNGNSNSVICFSDDDNNIGDLNSSGFVEGETIKSPDSTNSKQTNLSPQQELFEDNLHFVLNESNVSPSEHCFKKSEDSNEPVKLFKQKELEMDKKDSNPIREKKNFINSEQFKEKKYISIQNVQDDDFTACSTSRPIIEKSSSAELPKETIDKVNDHDEFGDFGVVSPVITSSDKNSTSNNDNDSFGDFGVGKTTAEDKTMNNDNDNFGDFGVGETTAEDKTMNNDNDNFGDFGVGDTTAEDKTMNNDNDNFGDFGVAEKIAEDKTMNSDNGFGDFRVAETIAEHKTMSNVDDGFGDFGVIGLSSDREKSISNNDGDDNGFGDFAVNSESLSLEDQSMHKNDDDDFADFGVVAASSNNENPKVENIQDIKKLGSFPPKMPSSSNSKIDENNDKFSDFGVAPPSISENLQSGKGGGDDDDDDEFGDFGVAPPSISKTLQTGKGDDDDDEFGDFGVAPPSISENLQSDGYDDDDDEFGDFGVAPPSISKKPQSGKDDDNVDDDEFGDFGVGRPSLMKEGSQSNNNEFGDFRTVLSTHKAQPTKNKNNEDGFGDFGAVTPYSEQSKDNLSDLSRETTLKRKECSETSSLEHKKSSSNEDVEFGQFDSAPSKSSDIEFADFTSSANISKGFADFSSMSQKSTPLSKNDVQREEMPKMSRDPNVIKPQRNMIIERISNPIKQCFLIKDITGENNVIVQLIEHEIHSELSRIWPQLLATGKDGSLRFDWVLSQHQIKMLEGLSMLPVKIQKSVSFKPGGKVPTPLFASSMGLLEPVKGVITPFYHAQDINPSQDPFGAPPEVGVQDLGFDKGNKKESPQLNHLPTEAKDNISDTISASSSLDLDFLAPSNTNGESTKTESRGLFEDDLLGLGMKFTEPSASPKILETKGQKSIFKFNNTTISLSSNNENLSEQAKTVVKDFEDLSFMLSKVLMFPLKSKELK